jgi:hypothetical protein
MFVPERFLVVMLLVWIHITFLNSLVGSSIMDDNMPHCTVSSRLSMQLEPAQFVRT